MPKKILIAHNYYQIAGGEDTVVANEMALLKKHGHEVVLYSRDNKELNEMGPIRKAGLFFTTIYNRRTYKEICEIIKREKIDIVHVHNTLNLISPSIYYAAKKCGLPVINTIHNFRMLCPRATLYRNERICEDCISKGLTCAIKGRCYRDSLAQTFVCVLLALIHRASGIYKYVNFLCLTDFNKEKLLEINSGRRKNIINPDKIYVKPNFMSRSRDTILPYDERENFVFFAGRLDESKGLDILMDSVRNCKVKIIIAGSGPMERELTEWIKDKNPQAVEFVGKLNHDEVLEYLAKAKALVLPTRWYEGFPMSIAESFSVGTPVIGPKMGNVGNIIKDKVTGFLFENGNSKDLSECINRFAKEDSGKASLGEDYSLESMYQGAFDEFTSKYTDEINYKMLIDIYDKISNKK